MFHVGKLEIINIEIKRMKQEILGLYHNISIL